MSNFYKIWHEWYAVLDLPNIPTIGNDNMMNAWTWEDPEMMCCGRLFKNMQPL
jgi:hypothetical protein